MGRVSRTAVVAWTLVTLGGCASITGLSDITEQQCAPNCDGGNTDVTIGEGGEDSSSSSGSGGSSSGSDTGSSSGSSGSSSGSSGSSSGGMDSGPDGPADTGIDSGGCPSGDLSCDGGCVQDGVQNCGGCGQACAAAGGNGVKANGTACTGTTCLYQCQTGYLDCNGGVGFDPDGCECNATAAASAACCGTACPIEHSVGTGLSGGVSSNFYDCVATGSYTSQLATDACAAYFGTASDCTGPGQCTTSTDAGSGDYVVCGSTNLGTAECICWEYQGPNVGKLLTTTGANLGQCYCPGSTGPGFTQYNWQ